MPRCMPVSAGVHVCCLLVAQACMPVACLLWQVCMLVATPVALTGAWVFLRFSASSLYSMSRNGMNSGVLRMAHVVVQTFPVRHDRVCVVRWMHGLMPAVSRMCVVKGERQALWGDGNIAALSSWQVQYRCSALWSVLIG